MLAMLRNTHVRTTQFTSVQCLFSAKDKLCKHIYLRYSLILGANFFVSKIGHKNWTQKKLAPKINKKHFFSQHKFCSLKAYAHYFTVLIYLAT